MTYAPLVAIALIAAIGFALHRTEAFQRLVETSLAEEPRARAFPTMLKMFWDFFPFGTGFGSFDPVFRMYEPFELLKHGYLNHAHNDLLELGITGGLLGLIIAAIFCFSLARRMLRVVTARRTSRDAGFKLLAVTMIVFVLVSSLVDYPLRTPLISFLFMIACGWLYSADNKAAASAGGTGPGEKHALR
ncbi:MAG: hypothetical protein EON59_05495 [Alphaproteobacteria bacterium]|nr:MAG: hypothetical protein EON59_05495 [Alphaproteobacteria bacterium]